MRSTPARDPCARLNARVARGFGRDYIDVVVANSEPVTDGELLNPPERAVAGFDVVSFTSPASVIFAVRRS